MAGEAVVGALRVVLGMDTVSFEEGIGKATKSAENFGATLKSIFTATAVIGSITAITAAVLKTTESMDNMGKAAQKTGTTVEQFSALSYAASLADVSTEQLSTSMERLSKNMSAVAGGAKGPATEAFKALGISVKDSNGELKTTPDIIGEIADKFAGFRDSAAKTALAIAIFGKSGAEIIPLLNEGSKGIKSATDEAAKFGLVVTEQAAKGAEEFNDNLKRLGAVMQGILIQATSQAAGQMAALSTALVEVAKSTDLSNTAISGIVSIIQGFLTLLVNTSNEITQIAAAWTLLKAVFQGSNFKEINAAWDEYNKKSADATAATERALKAIQDIGTTTSKASLGLSDWVAGYARYLSDLQKTEAPTIASENAIDKLIQTLQKHQAVQAAEIASFGQLAGVQASQRVQEEALAVAKSNNITITQAQTKALVDLQIKAQDYANTLQGLQIQQANLSPLQAYNQEMTKLSLLLAENKISFETFEAAGLKAATSLRNAYGQVAGQIVGDMATAFKDLAALNHQYAGLAKGFAIGQALISTYLAANNAYAQAALLGGPVLGAIAAAAAVAAGLANVAKISATEFATGGKFKVGGAGGMDSQLVTMALTPGELVDVRKPGQDSSGGVAEVTVRGMGVKDFFTGTQLRDLVDVLNAGYRDGYKLKVA